MGGSACLPAVGGRKDTMAVMLLGTLRASECGKVRTSGLQK